MHSHRLDSVCSVGSSFWLHFRCAPVQAACLTMQFRTVSPECAVAVPLSLPCLQEVELLEAVLQTLDQDKRSKGRALNHINSVT